MDDLYNNAWGDSSAAWGSPVISPSTQYSGGVRREEYSRYEQDDRGGSYGYQQKVETSSYGGGSGGGYERHEERRYESGNQWQSEDRREGFDQSGDYYKKEKK